MLLIISLGAFFGETGLFFRTPRSATIRASSRICVCYSLSKKDLDDVVKHYEIDARQLLGINTTACSCCFYSCYSCPS